MTSVPEPVSAKDRLAGSRAALLHEMGFNTLPTAGSIPSDENTFSKPVSSVASQAIDRPSPWISMGKSAIKNWWVRHPANAALTLAKPVFAQYAAVHPGKVVVCGAAVGAVLYVVRPWRMLSVTTIAALVFKRSTVARMITHYAEHLPTRLTTRTPMLPAAGRPENGLDKRLN